MAAQLPLLLPRTDASRPDEETGVNIAWALDGGRPVHIARYSHLRDGGARPELACLGCTEPVVPVLPRVGGGRPHRLDHFRHRRASPECWAQHGIGARLWNAILRLHRALDDMPVTERSSLVVAAWCDPGESGWAQALPLFSTRCPHRRRLPVPTWDQVRLTKTRRGAHHTPHIRFFFGPNEVLRLGVAPPDPTGNLGPLSAEGVPRIEVHVDDLTYERVLTWTGPELPCTRATSDMTWRCADHR